MKQPQPLSPMMRIAIKAAAMQQQHHHSTTKRTSKARWFIYLPYLIEREASHSSQQEEASVTQLLWDKSASLIWSLYHTFHPYIQIQDQVHLRQNLYSFFIEAYHVHALGERTLSVCNPARVSVGCVSFLLSSSKYLPSTYVMRKIIISTLSSLLLDTSKLP